MDTLAFLLMILVFVASLAIQGGLQATFARYGFHHRNAGGAQHRARFRPR